jgi:hypothetical protein
MESAGEGVQASVYASEKCLLRCTQVRSLYFFYVQFHFRVNSDSISNKIIKFFTRPLVIHATKLFQISSNLIGWSRYFFNWRQNFSYMSKFEQVGKAFIEYYYGVFDQNRSQIGPLYVSSPPFLTI